MKKPTTIAATLLAVKKLLTPEEAWIKGVPARTSPNGAMTYPCSKEAKCFCLWGAVDRVANGGGSDVHLLLSAASGRRNGHAAFNDAPSTTHADIHELLDYAIAHAKGAGV